MSGLLCLKHTGVSSTTSVKSTSPEMITLKILICSPESTLIAVYVLVSLTGTTSTSWWVPGGPTWRTCTSSMCLFIGSSSVPGTWSGLIQALFTGFRPLAGATILHGMLDPSQVRKRMVMLITSCIVEQSLWGKNPPPHRLSGRYSCALVSTDTDEKWRVPFWFCP